MAQLAKALGQWSEGCGFNPLSKMLNLMLNWKLMVAHQQEFPCICMLNKQSVIKIRLLGSTHYFALSRWKYLRFWCENLSIKGYFVQFRVEVAVCFILYLIVFNGVPGYLFYHSVLRRNQVSRDYLVTVSCLKNHVYFPIAW